MNNTETARFLRPGRALAALTGFLTLLAHAAAPPHLPPEMRRARAARPMPKALQFQLKNPWAPPEKTLAIPIGDEPTSRTLTFPGRRLAKHEILVMRFRTRLATKGFGGWNNYLEIKINGQRLDYFTRDGAERILNRRERFIRTSAPKWPRQGYFQPAVGVPALLVPFGPRWDTLEPRFTSDRREGYWYVLDITDAARQTGTNTIRFTNLARAASWGKSAAELRDSPLLVDSLEIGTLPDSVRAAAPNIDAEFKAFHPAARITSAGAGIDAAPGGALRIRRAGATYILRSAFSEPGPAIRRHFFQTRPDPSWTVRVEAISRGIRITGTCAAYAIRRSITLPAAGNFIQVRDEYRNRTTAAVGIIITHDLLAGRPAASWRLAGLKQAPESQRPGYNPTVFIQNRNAGLGAAVKDGVFRNGMTLEASFRRRFRMTNEHFGLGPGRSYTVSWQLYAGGPDFWDFINRLRRNWHVNHTIPGMYGFFYPSTPSVTPPGVLERPERLQAYLDRLHLDVFAIEPWFEYYYAPKWWKPRAVFRARVQKTAAAIKRVEPGARVIACLESFLYYAPKSFFKGTLPKFWTEHDGRVPRQASFHNTVLSPEGTACVDASPWRDSVFRNRDGRVVIDLYYAQRYHDGGVNLKVFPTLDNYWQHKFLDMLDYCTETCGLDGVYIDSFSYYNQRTYGFWDGHSVDIDPRTGRIRRKYADLTLVTAKARREWVEHCARRGKIVFVNGKPLTPELQDTPQVSFMEAEWSLHLAGPESDAPRAAQAMLSTPLALGIRPSMHVKQKKRYPEALQRAVIAYLRYGALYCFYAANILPPGPDCGYGVLNHMFPFTPIELHEGWVVGKERIVTARSGRFQWPHPERPTCLRFDLRGRPEPGGFHLTRTSRGWQIRVDLDDWNETAVIEGAPPRSGP